jgi:hypothetical protein
VKSLLKIWRRLKLGLRLGDRCLAFLSIGASVDGSAVKVLKIGHLSFTSESSTDWILRIVADLKATIDNKIMNAY